MADNKTIATPHFMLADNFLQLVENVLNEAIKTGNLDVYIGTPRDDIREHYRQLTKWSDFRIIVPTLFNFFHGIELLLKAGNYKIATPSGSPNHKLSDLFINFKTNYPNSTELTNLLDKYIYPNNNTIVILNDFYASNNITDSSQFYEVFKYPFTKDFQVDFNYSSLTNLGNDGITFFTQIMADIKIIRTESEKI